MADDTTLSTAGPRPARGEVFCGIGTVGVEIEAEGDEAVAPAGVPVAGVEAAPPEPNIIIGLRPALVISADAR